MPFLGGGYSLGFRRSCGHAINIGAGVHYWLTEGVGLRVEFRDHMPVEDLTGTHLWGVRVGFTWARIVRSRCTGVGCAETDSEPACPRACVAEAES
jgi:hypothetical protein